jgi:acetyl esterase/lipase
MKIAGWGLAALAAAVALTTGDPSVAQDASKYYSVTHASEFPIDFANDLYAAGDRRTAETRKRLEHHLDLAYGDHQKQKLDLYLPKRKAARAPVLVFLHGGGFSEGDRAHYGFIAAPFSEHGIVTAVASYRLSGYPDPIEDAKAIVMWLYKNIARYGGDPLSIYVSGHSAGAIMAGDIGADRRWLAEAGIPKSALKGIVPVSGRYELVAGSGLDNYAAGAEQRKLASPLLHINDPVPGVVIAYGYGSADEMESLEVDAIR